MVNFKFVSSLIICLFLTSSVPATHKFYTSITQIDYNEKSKSFEIIMRVFVDDLEKSITSQRKKNYKIANDLDNKLLNNYLTDKFLIQANQKTLQTKVIGTELERDILIIYLEALSSSNANTLRIKNSILTELFPSQTNIVNINFMQKKETLVCNIDQPEKILLYH